jgi:ATP-dependent DNA helicase PIF1
MLKLKALLADLLENDILGKVLAQVWVIEFQKRGLPHAHILLVLQDEDKPRIVDDYDRFVSAKIPDVDLFPQLYETVATCILHGSCDNTCLNGDGVCVKRFPKPFQEQTADNDDGYPLHRRRDNGVQVQRNGAIFTNQHVVPYNAFLAQKYNPHVNVEIFSSVKSVKYLFKYVHKGHDRTNRALVAPDVQSVDEVERFKTGRYVCVRRFTGSFSSSCMIDHLLFMRKGCTMWCFPDRLLLRDRPTLTAYV